MEESVNVVRPKLAKVRVPDHFATILLVLVNVQKKLMPVDNTKPAMVLFANVDLLNLVAKTSEPITVMQTTVNANAQPM